MTREDDIREIEELLPWYATGKLGASEKRRVEEALSRAPWLAGRSFSLADVDLLSFFGFLPKWSPEIVNEQRTPCTMDWIERMEERPAVRQLRARSRMPQRPADAERPGGAAPAAESRAQLAARETRPQATAGESREQPAARETRAHAPRGAP